MILDQEGSSPKPSSGLLQSFQIISLEQSILKLVSLCRLMCILCAGMARKGGDNPAATFARLTQTIKYLEKLGWFISQYLSSQHFNRSCEAIPMVRCRGEVAPASPRAKDVSSQFLTAGW